MLYSISAPLQFVVKCWHSDQKAIAAGINAAKEKAALHVGKRD